MTADRPTAPPFLSRRGLLLGGAAGLLSAGTVGATTPAGPTVPPLPSGRSQGLFRIATGTTGGTYYPVGTIIANALSNPPGTRPCDKGGSCGVPGLIAVALATGGSVDNVGQLLSGGAEAAMMQADVAWQAYTGSGVFEGKPPFDSMRTMGALYVEALHIVAAASAEVERVEDLRGLRVSLGEEGSGTLVDARLVLAAHGMKETDLKPFYLKPATAADRVAAGELDAFFMVGGHPIAAVRELAARIPVTLAAPSEAARTKLRAEHRFFVETAIPPDVYDNIGAVATVGVGAELVVRAERDPEFIYQVVRTLWHERTKTLLTEGHPRGAGIVVGNAVAGVAVPLHPGAERYYREVGVLSDPPTP